jgi:hypothetical protein
MVEIAENPSIVTKLLIFQNNYFQIIKIWDFQKCFKTFTLDYPLSEHSVQTPRFQITHVRFQNGCRRSWPC